MKKSNKIKFNIIIIIAIILFAIAIIPKELQEDTFYMIKVGEYVCKNGIQVITDRIEPFTWHEGITYTYPHWLMDVVFYLIYSLSGFVGIYGFTLIMGIIIYISLYYANVKIGKNYLISGIITLISIYFLQGYITARAQIITYLCCILTIIFIERFLETKKNRYIIGLVIVPIILANCHAALFPIYFVLYLPYIAEYIISFLTPKEIWTRILKVKNKKLEKLIAKNEIEKQERVKAKINKIENKINQIEEKEKTKKRKIIISRNSNIKWIIIIFFVCMLTGLLTPIKDMPYTYTFKALKGNTMNFISEHQAVTLIKSPFLLITYAVLAILLFSNKITIKLQDLFMVMGMSLLAIISYKQFPIFFIGVIFIINKLLYSLIGQNTKEKIKKIGNKVLSIKGTTYILMIIVILFLWRYRYTANQSYVNTNEYPVAAAEWIKENLNLKQVRLFNDFNYGSYLLMQEIPVFIDGRSDPYDEKDIFVDYMLTSSGQKWYGDVFDKYKITHVMTTANSYLDMVLQRNIAYRSIYNDGSFVIYKR